MLRHRLPATLLPAALSAATFAMAPAAAADKPQEKPRSVVAQSTDSTAATGRKPLAKRIAAANQPIRTAGPEWPIPGVEPAAAVVAPLGDTLGAEALEPTATAADSRGVAASDPELIVDVPAPEATVDPAIACPGQLDESLVVTFAPATDGDGTDAADSGAVIAATDPLVTSDEEALDAAAPAIAATPRRATAVPRVNAQLVTPPETPSSTPILDRFRDSLSRWPRPFGLLSGSDTVAHSHQPAPPARARQAQGTKPRSAARRPAMAPIAVADGPAVDLVDGQTVATAETVAAELPIPSDEQVQWVAADASATGTAEGAAPEVTVGASIAPDADEATPAAAEVLALVAGDPSLPTELPAEEPAPEAHGVGEVAGDFSTGNADSAPASGGGTLVATIDEETMPVGPTADATATDQAADAGSATVESVATVAAAAPATVAPAPVPRTHLAERYAARPPQTTSSRELLIDRVRSALDRLPRPLGLIPRSSAPAHAVAQQQAPRRPSQPQQLAGRAAGPRPHAGVPVPTAPETARTVDPASASVPLADDGSQPGESAAATVDTVTTAEGVASVVGDPCPADTPAGAPATDSVALELTGLPDSIGVDQPFTFTVAIHNASTTTIRGVVAHVFFDVGIEPVVAEGIPGRLAPGVVAFDTIATIEAGATATATIRAVGVVANTVAYRIDLSCAELDSPLSAEGTVTVTAAEAK